MGTPSPTLLPFPVVAGCGADGCSETHPSLSLPCCFPRPAGFAQSPKNRAHPKRSWWQQQQLSLPWGCSVPDHPEVVAPGKGKNALMASPEATTA